MKIAVTDNELRNQPSQQRRGRHAEDTEAAESCERLLRELPTPATLAVSTDLPFMKHGFLFIQLH